VKETTKSLRIYFIAAGVLSLYFSVTGLRASPDFVTLVLNGSSLVLALGFVGVGVMLPKLLAGSVMPINVLLVLAALRSAAQTALSVMQKDSLILVLVVQAVILLLCWYLYANTKRLAAEAAAAPTK
jgi:hypothetical protein